MYVALPSAFFQPSRGIPPADLVGPPLAPTQRSSGLFLLGDHQPVDSCGGSQLSTVAGMIWDDDSPPGQHTKSDWWKITTKGP